jgi:hypothetical protein
MIGFSYMISVPLKDSLQKIEMQRIALLTTAIAPNLELKLRFEATLNRCYWSLALSRIPLSKQDVEQFLTNEIPTITTYPSRKRKLSDEKLSLLRYKQGLDFINREWYVNRQPVTLATFMTMTQFAETKKLKIPEENLIHLLEYMKSSSDNPVIQAAIMQMQIACMAPFEDGNGRLSRLMAYLFLYKFGYDFRGLLVMEDYWRRDMAAFYLVKEKVMETKSLTLWLEYFAEALATQLEKAHQKIKVHEFQPPTKGLWDLNDRQKSILEMFENPDLTLTNRKVQHIYKISQVTASRDLSKLATLGLIQSHGKGRSVTYSRV